MGESASDFYPAIVAPYVDSDLKAPDRYAIYLNQSGLGLPDRDYYLKPRIRRAARGLYALMPRKLLSLIGWPDPAATAAKVIAFETDDRRRQLGQGQAARPDDPVQSASPAELAALAPGFDWNAYLDGARLGDRDRFIVGQPDAFTRLAATFASTPLDTVKAWMAFRVADQAAPYLSAAVRRRPVRFPRARRSGPGRAERRGGSGHARGRRRRLRRRSGKLFRDAQLGGRPALRGALFPGRDQGRGSRRWSAT